MCHVTSTSMKVEEATKNMAENRSFWVEKEKEQAHMYVCMSDPLQQWLHATHPNSKWQCLAFIDALSWNTESLGRPFRCFSLLVCKNWPKGALLASLQGERGSLTCPDLYIFVLGFPNVETKPLKLWRAELYLCNALHHADPCSMQDNVNIRHTVKIDNAW